MMDRPTVKLATGTHGDLWFGVAWYQAHFVATATGKSPEGARRALLSCLPAGTEWKPGDEDDDFFTDALCMLGELERGNETNKHFSFAREILSEAQWRILTVAASIPIGYVASYGNIAKAACSEARAVGRAMATNPLYPIVPCHRVVGSDFALVGYGGKHDRTALAAKLERLKAEMRGKELSRDIGPADHDHEFCGPLTIHPGEWVVRKAKEDLLPAGDAQLGLF